MSRLSKDEVLGTLRLLADGLRAPVWLAGGLAADFHVGRWTRDHDDVDLVAFEDDREALGGDLTDLGLAQTDERGWITRWTRFGRDVGEVSLAFERQIGTNTGALVFGAEHASQGLVPGVYPGVSGNLDPERFKTLEGVRFRVVSAEDEWAFATGYRSLRPEAAERSTVQHNLALLESVIDEATIARLRRLAGRRLPLDA